MTRHVVNVEGYLAALAPQRRSAIEAVRAVIRENLQPGFEEGMQYGMIGYFVPLARFPKTYNGQPLALAALASQKNYMSAYLMNVYGDEETRRWFEDEWKKTGKKLDMGKSCLRFKSVNDLPLELIGRAIARTTVDDFLAKYEATRAATKTGAKKPRSEAPSAK